MSFYTVVYRMGDKDNFHWEKSSQFQNYQEALACANEITKGGRKALIHSTRRLDIIGMPEGWEPTPQYLDSMHPDNGGWIEV